MASTQQTPGTTPAPTQQPLALPAGLDPDSLDTLSELTAILLRLRQTVAQTSTPAGSVAAAGTAGSGPSSSPAGGGGSGAARPGTSAAPTPAGSVGGASSLGGGEGGGGGGGGGGLALKDLPAATDAMKHRLQRARLALRTLPDVGRTVEEQRAEMELLRRRIDRQRAVLLQLKEMGGRIRDEVVEVVGDGAPPTGNAGDEAGTGDAGAREGSAGDRMEL